MEENKCEECGKEPCECKCEDCKCNPCECKCEECGETECDCVTLDDVDDKVDALIGLLLKKGVITEEEYEKAGEDLYEEEKKE